eukprot:TRINITY_DN5252_c0_g1_i1.p1 TRINITY_DN5252_c0_g1~~TRINITY_DN5252_c0_g1_i1.p1  ORF type:complete len:296 (+),score=67.98 TRINITY_DN5252_c0_g1_i1:123-890(+)
MRSRSVDWMPVFDPTRSSFVGQIERYELFTAMAMNFFERKTYSEEYLNNYFENWKFDLDTVRDLMYKYHIRSKISVFDESQSLEEAMMLLGDKDHRILIQMGDKYQFFDQLEVLKYFDPSKSDDIVLEQIGIKPVFTMKQSDKAVYGFWKMNQEMINAVAIVDDSNRIIDSLSWDSIDRLNESNLSSVKLPVNAFLKKIGENSDLICVEKGAKLSQIITKLRESSQRRVWIVDQKQSPIGIVSLTDIIRTLLNQD